MLAWFDTDVKCLDYLDWLRWPDGFVCPWCGGGRGWRLRSRLGHWYCGGCCRKVSPTAGTIFDKTRTPLTVWFAAAWQLTNSKSGISATWLQQAMELGSYQTAWAMLHRFRSVMVRPDRQRLSDRVEVDEAFIGGQGGGIGGRGALGKALVAIAIEVEEPQLLGRARMAVIDRATTKELKAFITANIEPGTTVVTDGLPAYRKAVTDSYDHERITFDGTGIDAHELLPGVHMVASLCKRWLLGTMHGAASPEHLQSYLDEFVFRFNRRHSRRRGLLFYRLLTLAVGGDPLTYRDMRKAGRTRPAPKTPGGKRAAPPSLALPDQGLPWRNTRSDAQPR
jgi:transposase-like protein